MNLNLNFSDVVADTSGPMDAGIREMRIINAEYVKAASFDKKDYVKIVVSPHVPPSDPDGTRKITHIFTMSEKNYPRLLFKTFLEAVLGVEITEMELDLNKLVNRTVRCDLAVEENTWTNKEGNEVTRDVNKIKGWYKAISDMTAHLQ